MTALSVSSQNQFDRVEFNVGLNSSSMTWYSSKLGFHAGARVTKNLDKQVCEGVYANAGALLSLKGGKVDLGELGKSTINACYLDIPIHIGYRHVLNDNIKIWGEVGPYFDFGLFGDQTSRELYSWEGTTYVKETTPSFDILKRFDAGIGFRIGADYQKYTFAVGYDAGVLNSYKTDYDDEDIDMTGTAHQKNFYVSVGYIF